MVGLSMIREMRRRGSRSAGVTEEVLVHGMPSLVWGAGRPLVYLRGFSTAHTNPTGVERLAEMQMLRPLAGRFRVHAVARPPGLPAGITMAGIAAQHGSALRGRFSGPVDVLGVSSGGSIALQLAADHPSVVRRWSLRAAATGSVRRPVRRSGAMLRPRLRVAGVRSTWPRSR